MMSRLPRPIAAAIALVVMLASGALAAAPSVTLTLSGVAMVRQADGSFKEAPVADVTLKSGDKVRYSILAVNKGDAPALALTPQDPVPARMQYVANSATTGPATPEFTLDGKTWSAHPTVLVKTANGQVRKPAPVSDYKAVRWVMTAPLPPKASVKFVYEAVVK